MNNIASIAGQDGKLIVEVLGYENPQASNVDDANWLAVLLSAVVGPFAGKFRVAFTAYDLLALYEKLKTVTMAFSGSVFFQSTEGNLSLEVKFASNGTATLEGVIQPSASYKASLHFRFEIDAGALAAAVKELSTLVEHFPARLETSVN